MGYLHAGSVRSQVVYVLSTIARENAVVKPKPDASTEADRMSQNAGARRRDNYQSYLLRLWRAGESGGWRASLEDTASRQKHFFGSFARLVEFLEGRFKLVSRVEPGSPSEGDGGE